MYIIALLMMLVFFPLAAKCEERIVLSKDIVVPFGQDYVDLPVVSVDSPIAEKHIGYGIHIDYWTSTVHMCRIHLNKNTDMISKGSIVVFDGRKELETTRHGVYAHNFFVKQPSEISHISFGIYIDHYRSLMGENATIIGRTFPKEYR